MLSSNKQNATHNYVEKHNSLGRCSVSRYVYIKYSHHIQQEKDQAGKVANPGIIGCKYKTSCLLLFLTSSVLVASPKNTTFILHGDQSRSWSAEHGGGKRGKQQV